ncbi:hypothetical protein [Desulforhabdus sp. TSK]|uniref:hypothetical protein n=1 Tax=Desulforhabdus sp. TSK TaxID=2925014 RepID=UPI001FC8CF6E|nr:hypothetical protein [Desulforhabdus sp. TSK]GKT09785.1 hypothetical protein DSTSK_30900 [Desulforhabdus sp. TSK]
MDLKTITGKNLIEAFRELDRQLPAHAYKKIEGGKGGKLGLTDIIPAFLPDLLLELFGPIGYGWGFHLDSMESSTKTVERKGGYTEEEVTANCKLSIWYRFLRDGEVTMSEPIPATGGSTNTLVEWAMKGALTNALGCAWFFAGYQLSVYKNERSHNGDGQQQGQGQKSQQAHQDNNRQGQRTQTGNNQLPSPNSSNGHSAWQAAASTIDQMLIELNLPPDRYWRYAAEKYKAARDNLTVQQLQEQVALLSQCRQNPVKLDQFRGLLGDSAGKQSTQPEDQQGGMH